jgi:hypothetical protein
MMMHYEIEVDIRTRTGERVTMIVQPLPGLSPYTTADLADMQRDGVRTASLRHDHRPEAWRIVRVEGAKRELLAAG